MTTRETPFAAGTPCWVDVMTSDHIRAKAFYGSLFGWTFDESGEEFGYYVTFLSDGHPVAGLTRNTPEMGGGRDVWTTYLASDDAAATAALAEANGGKVHAPAMDVGEVGRMAVVEDPAGAFFGVWQPGTHTGFGKYNEPGSVTWDEVHSKDFAATTAFYPAVFGWTVERMSDTDEFRYYTGQINGESVAGMMDSKGFLPPEVPSHWAVYFSVEDTDAALARVPALGGTVLRPAEDTPFGRVADVADPTGAVFKLHSTKTLVPQE